MKEPVAQQGDWRRKELKMNGPPRLSLRVRGELACFTRPEFKAERASYPWVTPSAGRAIFEAICWKPAIRWDVRRISLLSPVRFTSFRRNEINTKIAPAKAKPGAAWHFTDADRAQRNTVALRDVDYLIEADLHMTDRAGPGDNINKFVDMFTRRLKKGQYFTMPYLGCREFAADVMEPDGSEEPIGDAMDHGMMFYDLAYAKPGSKDANVPMFFDAKLDKGVVEVPPRDEVMGGVA